MDNQAKFQMNERVFVPNFGFTSVLGIKTIHDEFYYDLSGPMYDVKEKDIVKLGETVEFKFLQLGCLFIMDGSKFIKIQHDDPINSIWLFNMGTFPIFPSMPVIPIGDIKDFIP